MFCTAGETQKVVTNVDDDSVHQTWRRGLRRWDPIVVHTGLFFRPRFCFRYQRRTSVRHPEGQRIEGRWCVNMTKASTSPLQNIWRTVVRKHGQRIDPVCRHVADSPNISIVVRMCTADVVSTATCTGTTKHFSQRSVGRDSTIDVGLGVLSTFVDACGEDDTGDHAGEGELKKVVKGNGMA